MLSLDDIGITMGGQTLPSILMQILKAQQETNERLAAHDARLSSLENWVQAIAQDLALNDQSPSAVPSFRLPMHQQVKNAHLGIKRLDYHRKVGLSNALAISNAAVVRTTYFEKFYAFYRIRKLIREQTEATTKMAVRNTLTFMRSVYWRMQQYVKHGQKQKRRIRAVRVVALHSFKQILRRYYNKFLTRHYEIQHARDERRRINFNTAQRLEGISTASIALRYYYKYRTYYKDRKTLYAKANLCESLGLKHGKSLATKYYTKWVYALRFKQQRQHRLRMMWNLLGHTKEFILRMYFAKLVEYRRLRLQKKSTAKVCEAMGFGFGLSVARRHYAAWVRYTKLSAKRREKVAVDNMFMELARRNDALGTQIDVGLKTLSNTNAVLNKLVDRLITVDEHLDLLDRDKVGRRELGMLADRDIPQQQVSVQPPLSRIPPQTATDRQRKDYTPLIPPEMSTGPSNSGAGTPSPPIMGMGGILPSSLGRSDPEVDSIVQKYLSAKQRVMATTQVSSGIDPVTGTPYLPR